MPDITMCANKTCVLRKNCYRSRAKPDQYQSYAGYIPVQDQVDKSWYCEDFVEIRCDDELSKEE
jgi:hypothetical protein